MLNSRTELSSPYAFTWFQVSRWVNNLVFQPRRVICRLYTVQKVQQRSLVCSVYKINNTIIYCTWFEPDWKKSIAKYKVSTLTVTRCSLLNNHCKKKRSNANLLYFKCTFNSCNNYWCPRPAIVTFRYELPKHDMVVSIFNCLVCTKTYIASWTSPYITHCQYVCKYIISHYQPPINCVHRLVFMISKNYRFVTTIRYIKIEISLISSQHLSIKNSSSIQCPFYDWKFTMVK